jgi:hypothetical protein
MYFSCIILADPNATTKAVPPKTTSGVESSSAIFGLVLALAFSWYVHITILKQLENTMIFTSSSCPCTLTGPLVNASLLKS